MFRYMKLVDHLKEVLQKGKQLKSVLYNSTSIKKTQVGAALSLLSLIVNNYDSLNDCCERIEARSGQVANRYLLMVLVGEFINVGKIVGGGRLKRLVVHNQDLIPAIDRQSKIIKEVIQLRIRKANNKQKQSPLGKAVAARGEKDPLIPGLYVLKYENYSKLTKE
jgi:hypothetical protein